MRIVTGAIARKIKAIVPPAKKRRLKWTCRYCGHTFSTWTRRGLRVTCRNPKCGRVQEGPAGIELMAARLGELQPVRAPAKEIKVITSRPTRRASTSSPSSATPKAAAAPARSATTPPVSAPPAQPPAAASAPSFAERVGKVFFGGSG